MRSKRIEDRLADVGSLQPILLSPWVAAFPGAFFSSTSYRLSLLLFLLVAGCESTSNRAPVIDRAATGSPEAGMVRLISVPVSTPYRRVTRSTALRGAKASIKRIWRSGIISRMLAPSISVSNLIYRRPLN